MHFSPRKGLPGTIWFAVEVLKQAAATGLYMNTTGNDSAAPYRIHCAPLAI